MAVGNPCMSSTAKVGPDNTARGCLRPSPSGITSDIISHVSLSRPLLRQSSGVSGAMCCLTPARNALLDWTGTAWTMKSEPGSACAGSVVALMFVGSSYWGRYLAFLWSSLMDSASASDRTRMTTSRSALLRANSVAIAVPKDPPPMTATFFVVARTSSFFEFFSSTRRDQRITLSQLWRTASRSSSLMPCWKRSYTPLGLGLDDSDASALTTVDACLRSRPVHRAAIERRATRSRANPPSPKSDLPCVCGERVAPRVGAARRAHAGEDAAAAIISRDCKCTVERCRARSRRLPSARRLSAACSVARCPSNPITKDPENHAHQPSRLAKEGSIYVGKSTAFETAWESVAARKDCRTTSARDGSGPPGTPTRSTSTCAHWER